MRSIWLYHRIESQLKNALESHARTSQSLNQLSSMLNELDGSINESMRQSLRNQSAPDDWEDYVSQQSALPDGESAAASESRTEPAEKSARMAPIKELLKVARIVPLEELSGETKGTKDRQKMELVLGQRWALALGIVTMIFGVGYFLKYSFEQGWVGPAGRVAAAYLWGIVFLVGGNVFRKKNLPQFGLPVSGAGIVVLYFATYAGSQMYGLFGLTLAFAVMVLITALSTALAVAYDNKRLAILAVAGGFLTPVLLSSGEDHQVFLMTYMCILNLGMLSVAYRKDWPEIVNLAFVLTVSMYAGWYVRNYHVTKFWPSIIFLNVFYLIFSIAPFVHSIYKKDVGRAVQIWVIMANSVFALAFAGLMIQGRYSYEWTSVLTLSYAALFLAKASFLYRTNHASSKPFIVYVGGAAMFLIITAPLIFSEHLITLTWAAQAIVLAWFAYRFDREDLYKASAILLAAATMKFMAFDYFEVFGFTRAGYHFRPSYAETIAARYVSTIMMLGLSWYFIKHKVHAGWTSHAGIKKYSAMVWGLMFFALANCETSGLFYEYLRGARFAAISVLWTAFSACFMYLGFRRKSEVLRKISMALFISTLIKVFLVDTSNLDTPYRIVSFIVLGLVLIGTSYVYHRFRDQITEAAGEESAQ